jgi:hypothetical protein
LSLRSQFFHFLAALFFEILPEGFQIFKADAPVSAHHVERNLALLKEADQVGPGDVQVICRFLSRKLGMNWDQRNSKARRGCS